MKKIRVRATIVLAAIIAFSCISAAAQTLTLNDGAIIQSKTNRVGLNIGAMDYYDNGQILKNLIGSTNPGMEPITSQQIWALAANGTQTTFTVPDQYDGVPPNYWAGGTFTVVESQSRGAELGCTGAIASNTGPNYPISSSSPWTAPVVTVGATNQSASGSTGCAAPFSVGDIVIMSYRLFPTPESWWELNGQGGVSGSVANGGQLLSDTTDLCATCGTQALNLNATVSGSSAIAQSWFDSASSVDIFVLMNGTYQLSFWAKTAAGTPTLTVSAGRLSNGGFNCGPYTPALTQVWTQYTYTCTASETQAGTSPGNAYVSFEAVGGSVYLDNQSFEKVANPSYNNPTVLRDEVLQTLQRYYGPSAGANPGMFRYWVNQNAETMNNWTQPDYAHGPTGWGTGYFVGPGGSGSVVLSVEDYLVICQFLNAEPYMEVPVTFSTADAASLIEFLAAPSTSTYGARRVALGQTAPWTSVFSTIHLSFCNECWNGQSFAGQSLAFRGSAPSGTSGEYYDYGERARDIFASMRADSYYTASAFDLVMNAQTANNYGMDAEIALAHPDSIEIEDYTYGAVNTFDSDFDIWTPAMFDPWEKVTNPADIVNFYQSVHDYQSQNTCGAAGNAPCNVNIYEWGQGTLGSNPGSTNPIPQATLDYVNAGAGEGVVMALQPLLNMQYYGIGAQSFFSMTEYDNGGTNGATVKLWGNVVDMGGATNNVRPTFLGVQLINQSIIGPMYSCPIDNNLTYNFAGSQNGAAPMPTTDNVPYLYAFCFENGTSRSLVLINTDLANGHTLTFAGSNPPAGSVTERQYAPAALDDMNEAPTGALTNLTSATVSIRTSTLSSPGSITLPPYSVTALDYTAGSLVAPTFSPAPGTYATSQSVTISDVTAGATIYYTTNGTTPTASSNVYTTPIPVSASETLQAIAVAAGFASSAVASATYSISTQPAPAGLTAAAGNQQVSLSWTAATGAASYNVYEGTKPGGEASTPIATGITALTYTVSGLVNGTTYYFTVAAVGAGGTSILSNEAAATPAVPTSGLLAYEPFGETGTTPFALNAASGGGDYGWASAWTVQGSTSSVPGYNIASANPPTYQGLATGATGQYAVGGSDYLAAGRPLDVTASGPFSAYLNANGLIGGSGQTIWISFLLRQDASGGDPYIGLTSQSGSISYWVNSGIEVGYFGGSGTPYWGLQYVNGTTATTVLSGVQVVPNQTVLMVLEITFGATNTVNLYVSPSSATFGGAAPAASATYSTANSLAFQSIAFYGGNASNQSSLANILVGTSYAAVTPAAASTVAATPTFSLASGTYTTPQSVTISDATAGATIYYTTNGTAPTTSSSVYSGPITVSATETLEAIAVETGYTNSSVATATYNIAPVLPTPTFSLAPGTYTTSQSVTISDTTAGTTIYYTTNGTAPTTSSSVYSGPITVSATETLEAIAVETGYTNSSVATATYTIAPVLPTPTFSLAPGTYTTSQSVTINDTTAGTTIYYTTNGTVPTTSSSVYSGPITVSATEALEAIAVKAGYTNSSVATAVYTISGSTSYINYPSGGFTSSSLSLNYGASVTSGGLLQLTDGGQGEMRSAWFRTKVPVQSFVTDFTFRQLDATADGMTFTIQGQNVWALGYSGGGLGYQGIPTSVAIKFDLYNDAGEGNDSTGLYTDGAAPTVPAVDLSSTGINLHSQDIMDAHLVYDGTNLTMTLTDTATKASVTKVFPVNIPGIVGSSTAYVGFTGATGAKTSTQRVLSWTFMTP